MVKYKPELKAKIVHEYLSTAQSTYDLSEKYHIGRRQIAKWIQGYRLNGPDVLKRQRHKRNFTADFKLNVINYYQTHEDSMAEVAARFNVSPPQISVWRSIFEREGIMAFQLSTSPNKELIMRTLEELIDNLPDGVQPIIHSDQGWHYQLAYYTQKLADHHFIQSMSRKGNCLDNAPVESFFHLYKTELLAGFPPCKDITELRKLSQNYVQYFNNVRTTLKTKGMIPVEYRNHALVA